jgi:hypothetical protein
MTDNYVHVSPNRSLTGHITFTRLAAGALGPDHAEIRATPEVGDVITQTVSVDARGNFQITLPPDRYMISVRSDSWLRQTGYADLTNGDLSGFEIELPNGDALPDNMVDLRDLNLIFVYFGEPGQLFSDLNRDGITGLIDFNIVVTNFGMKGDP